MDKLKDLLKTSKQLLDEKKQHRSIGKLHDSNIVNIVNNLNNKGYHILENYISSEMVSVLKNEVDRLFKDYKNFAWSDSEDSDHRIHGSQRGSKLIAQFNKDDFLQLICDAFLGHSAFPFSTLSARLYSQKNSLGSGGGWHRDTPYESKQFKAILYLTDVGMENGPFQYVDGTQNEISLYRNIWKHNIKYGQHRFEDDEVEKILKDKYYGLTTFPGTAGTLLLVNTFGLHRGMPIKSGTRYALTNYYYKKAEFNTQHFEKKFNLIK